MGLSEGSYLSSLRGAEGDAAIQSGTRRTGLLRCARNDIADIRKLR